MAMLDLDKVINISGGGGGTYPIDSPYPVLTQSLGIFNKPNAWDTNSNGWMGLLYNSSNSINGQNNIWNTQVQLAVEQGTTNLATRVKSFDFSTNIEKIDTMTIKAALFNQQVPYVTLDESSRKIDKVLNNNTTNYLGSSVNRKVYIATSGGNKYIITVNGSTLQSTACDSDGRITTSTPNTISMAISGGSGRQVLAVMGGFIWVGISTNPSNTDIGITLRLYSMNSLGAFTLVDTSVVRNYNLINQGSSTNITVNGGSYIVNNTAHCYMMNQVRGGSGANYYITESYFTIDLTSTGNNTFSEIFGRDLSMGLNQPGMYGMVIGTTPTIRQVPVGFDGSKLIYIPEGNQLWDVDGLGFFAFGFSYVTATQFLQYRSTSTLFTNPLINNYHTTNDLRIQGTLVPGSLAGATNSMWIYDMTGTNQEDDPGALRGIHLNTTGVYGQEMYVDFKVNGSIETTIDNRIGGLINIVSSNITLNSPSVEVELELENTNSQQMRLGIGITGGTYASPTGNNGYSAGNATTAWAPGTNASYMDLTLSA